MKMPGEEDIVPNAAQIAEAWKGPMDVVVDIGAHHGGFSVAALKKGAKRLVAVEACWDNFEILCSNLQPFVERANITVLRAAVAPVSGRRVLIRRLENTGRSSVCSSNGNELGNVLTVSLPMVLELAGAPIDLLKMDIEGGEYGLLLDLASREAICRHVAHGWHLELHGLHYVGHTLRGLPVDWNDTTLQDKVEAVIEGMGFAPTPKINQGCPEPMTRSL